MAKKTFPDPDGTPPVPEAPDPLADAPLFDRRRFNRLAGSTLLAGPMISTAHFGMAQPYSGSEDEDGGSLGYLIEQIVLRNNTIGRVILTGILLILATGALYYIDVSQGAQQYDENRLSTGGLFGGLTRPTIRERLATASVIGTAHIFGTILILQIAAGFNLNPASLALMVAHRQLSWDVRRLRAITGIQGLPSLAQLRALVAIGTIYLVASALLMVLVPPPNRY